jgi:hypothetical protein
MAAGGTPNNVQLGAGRLYYAPLGTAEPASATSVMPSAWKPIGYTENGTEITIDTSAEDIMVAEELDPIDRVVTARTIRLAVEMAESTKSRLLLAVGAGATALDDGTAFELPKAGDEVPVMLVWDSTPGATPAADNRRWLFRAAQAAGTITTVRRKAPAKNSIQATFTAIVPNATDSAIKVYSNAAGQV